VPLHPIRSCAVALAAAVCLAPVARATEAAKPAKAWDQAAVAKLAAELAKACDAIYGEYYAEQGLDSQIGSGDSADSFRLKYKLQRLEEETRGLAGSLAAGHGRDETVPRVEDIGILARDLRVILARMFVRSQLQARVDSARSVWLQLLPYYGIAPPSDEPPRGS
jgi:hypothetical protein